MSLSLLLGLNNQAREIFLNSRNPKNFRDLGNFSRFPGKFSVSREVENLGKRETPFAVFQSFAVFSRTTVLVGTSYCI